MTLKAILSRLMFILTVLWALVVLRAAPRRGGAMYLTSVAALPADILFPCSSEPPLLCGMFWKYSGHLDRSSCPRGRICSFTLTLPGGAQPSTSSRGTPWEVELPTPVSSRR